ncbi:MAG: preprotein translocase subunit YajC [Lactobacillales bacterium]|jgi:preprotein translocase subunit YajC|nr:preprotein translocase subunit YajC [Lactobacillales bacterium]
MLISPAHAQTAEVVVETPAPTPAPTNDIWNFAIQFGLIIVILYFLLIRPQQKKLKRHEAELNAIIKGSKVIVGGVIGTVVDVVDAQTLRVKIADDVIITVLRGYVSQVVFDDKK